MHRFLPLLLTIAVLSAVMTIASCGRPGEDGVYVIPLTDSLNTAGSGRFQLYYAVQDTALWEATLAAADTVVPDIEPRFKFRSNGIWYTGRNEKGETRSSQHYPGWERRIDSVDQRRNLVRLLNNQRVLVTMPSAQVELDGDSITIALMRVIGQAFEWQEAPDPQPDYLLLNPVNTTVAYVAMDADNIGPVTNQTVFRVGRKYYALTSVADDYSTLTVERIPEARGIPLAAELETQYKRVPVKTVANRDTTIHRTPGRDLAVYFFALGGDLDKRALEVDSLYRELPAKRQKELDIALVCRYAFADSLQSFVNRHNVQLPVYLGTEKTCNRLNCSSYLPFFVGVNGKGRVGTYHGRHDYLVDRLHYMLEEEKASR